MNVNPVVINKDTISRVRRNHALEHATLNVLSSRRRGGPALAGYSDPFGFWIVGSVSTEELRVAADQALNRLRAGEYNLAIHPNCGTNFVVTGILAGTAAWLGMLGMNKTWRDRLDKLPNVILLTTAALVLGQPLGLKVQEKVTTEGDPGAMEIVRIDANQRAGVITHRVITRG
jgi:hypothetical protein